MNKFNDVTFTLGKSVTNYESLYNPGLLARHPRSTNRQHYQIKDDDLPFCGYDIWHAYEETFLLGNGEPVTFMMKIKIPVESLYIVESKSLKLYLYSFAMQKFNGSKEEAIQQFKATVESDLSKLLECTVTCSIFESNDYAPTSDMLLSTATELSEVCDYSTLMFEATGENPSLLQGGNLYNSLFIKSDMLRSRCLITKQPDTGTIYIYMSGNNLPTYESLSQYIYSLREEHHFHEEIVEAFYKRLLDIFKPTELMVTAMYNRRGGIDICPSRASSPSLLPTTLGDISTLTIKEYRQ